MRHTLSFLVFLLSFAFVSFSLAQENIQVDEQQTEIQLHSNSTEVILPIRNLQPSSVSTQVELTFLDPTGAVRERAEYVVLLAPGNRRLQTFLPPILGAAPKDDRDLSLWRLRYSVTPAGSNGETSKVTGVLSLAKITNGIFVVNAATAGLVDEGKSYAIRVRTVRPVTGHPVPGVAIQATLDFEDGQKSLKSRTALTDSRGFATLEVTLPEKLDGDDIEVTVTGNLGNYSAEASDRLQRNRAFPISISTDKSLYQPGQTLHMRLMAFDENKKAISDQAATISILEPEGTLAYSGDVRTSRYGIASLDWQIPASLRLGDYRIKADFQDQRYEQDEAWSTVKISRYELPTFRVAAKPDKGFYLPGDKPSVEVSADYLFGQPVRRGHVRLVRETEREWNYREQKWEVKEAESYEGDTDDQGRYIAHLDLTKDFDQLKAGEDRFHDIRLAAYFTDASTNKTEERRFDIRASGNPIHIYVIAWDGGRNDGLPLEFYVSTDYADGTPISCDVDIFQQPPTPAVPVKGAPAAKRFLRRIHTNRYGIGKVSGLVLDAHSENSVLQFDAKDARNRMGHHTEGFSYFDGPGIQVATDKALYQTGEPIIVKLRTSTSATDLVVEAVKDRQILASKVVRADNSRATVMFQTDDKFQDEVTLRAYLLGGSSDHDYSNSYADSGSRTVLFPVKHDLNLEVRFGKASYRPGEEASANISLRGPNEQQIQGALGLAVVDEAAEERQQADQEFDGGGESTGFYGFRGASQGEALGGITRSDLDKLDLSKPLPDGLELVAEVLLQRGTESPEMFSSDDHYLNLRALFAQEINPSIWPLRDALEYGYKLNGQYPRSDSELANILALDGLSFDGRTDPWGVPYRAAFRTERDMDVMEISSAGPDKQFETGDDFVVLRLARPYFKSYIQLIQRAADDFQTRTGGYIHDAATLKDELARQSIDFDSWKDPWGHGYGLKFGVSRAESTIKVISAGPDGLFSTQDYLEDDVVLANIRTDYYAPTRLQVDAALAHYYKDKGLFPVNDDELQTLLRADGIDWKAQQDPWGHAYYATFSEESRFTDEVFIQSYEQHESASQSSTRVVPVTQKVNVLYIRTAGEDGIEGTSDDATVATFFRAVAVQSSRDAAPVSTPGTVLSGAAGSIYGKITDPIGAALTGVVVTAVNLATEQTYPAKSGEEGEYLLRNLPAGSYRVEFRLPGFAWSQITSVPVRSSDVTGLNMVLAVAAQQTLVTVTTESVALETEKTEQALPVSSRKFEQLALLQPALSSPEQLATPRLREYFPETLYWQPELVTDQKGNAHLKVTLADNITTWKLRAVGSTINGEIGSAEKKIRAFQPFFVENDPPRFLTVGDEIDLPVVLRNYLDHKQQVSVQVLPQAWFSSLGPSTMNTTLAPRESASDIFRLRARSATKEAKHEVRAIGSQASDAISRTVTVRPYGEETTNTDGAVFRDTSSLEMTIPENILPDSGEATLKIYPNLATHILEAIEGILQRPHGCAEQTISAAYPDILFLKYAKQAGVGNTETGARARRYLELGYEGLLSFRSPNGGFTYWGSGEPDLALTAYAVQFLGEAGEFTAVDESVSQQALTWLRVRQSNDGRWIAQDWTGHEDERQTVILTAYIARVISGSRPSGGASKLSPQLSETLRRAMVYLASRVASIDEPYLLSSYALAAINSGSDASASLKKLRKLELHEGDTSYWSLETNTPFYGWGLAGRVETTALVLQALAKGDEGRSGATESDQSISRGLLFLLHREDHYGVWYSTQATINVLQALLSLALQGSKPSTAPGNAAILVDGREIASVAMPSPGDLTGPISLDLSKYVSAGTHRIEIHRPVDSAPASAQLVADFYVPWNSNRAGSNVHTEENSAEALRLAVQCDKAEAQVGEDVLCRIDAERIGFRGYGMMVAEIGLPPGADVDRASLERATTGSGGVINQYDVQPDRLVVYLWPRAGGTNFSFTFRPRYGVNAVSAPSTLFDYYNPEAHAVLEPTRFIVKASDAARP